MRPLPKILFCSLLVWIVSIDFTPMWGMDIWGNLKKRLGEMYIPKETFQQAPEQASTRAKTYTAEELYEAATKTYTVQDLYEAAKYGDINTLKVCIYKKMDINGPGFDGNGPLHLAAINEHLEAIEILIDAGAKIENLNDEGWTPLIAAAMWGSFKAVELLGKLGANINARDPFGATPLHTAAAAGNLPAMEVYAKMGMPVNALEAQGRTPLHRAAYWGQAKAVELLKKLGADMYIQDNQGDTPLHVAVCSEYTSAIEPLLKLGTFVDTRDSRGSTPLHRAAICGSTEIIALLKKCKADINAVDRYGDTALHIAVFSEKTEIINLLIKLGAFIHLVNKQGDTPYMIGAHIDFLNKKLLAQGTIDGILPNGFTQLGLAARYGNVAMIVKLLSLGANLNTIDDQGFTAQQRACQYGQLEASKNLSIASANALLIIAAKHGHVHLIDYYLNTAGAHINACDASGHSALYYASENQHIEAVYYLFILGADLEALDDADLSLIQGLLIKYQPKLFELIKALVALQQDIHQTDSERRSLLYLAARFADVDVVIYLIEQGIDYQQQDSRGQTVLHAAVHNKGIAVFEYLMQNCQDILHVIDYKQETVLHHVAFEGTLRMVELCVEYQLDFEARNVMGQTPLDLVLKVNRPKAIINEIRIRSKQGSGRPLAAPRVYAKGKTTRLISACEHTQNEQKILKNYLNANQTEVLGHAITPTDRVLMPNAFGDDFDDSDDAGAGAFVTHKFI